MIFRVLIFSSFIIATFVFSQKVRADQSELVFWKSIANSADGEEYCAYVAAYPEGKFLTLAQIRARKYGGPCITTIGATSEKTRQKIPLMTKTKDFQTPTIRKSFFTSENYFQGKMAFDSKDYKTAFRLWTDSAEHGSPEAQGLIGGLYHAGLGVQKNFSLAMDWYQKAAVKGVAQAQLGIGNLYGDGLGVEKDYIRARMWFAISANAGNERAQFNLKKISQRMSSDSIAKSEELALAWMKKHNQL